MGFDLLLIATNANGMKIPSNAKCCVCHMLLDDGVGLSGCSHNACYKCMKRISEYEAKCPLDGNPFDLRRYLHLSDEIEDWLSNIKLKCGWFDGHNCTATGIALRNAHHHKKVCPNNPLNKKTEEQIQVIKFVRFWMQTNDILRDDHNSDTDSGVSSQRRIGDKNNETIRDCVRTHNRFSNAGRHQKPRSGYGFRPNKRVVGQRFFASEMDPEFDSDWRK